MANEKRLIDANALMKRFYNYYDCVNEFTSKNGYRGETLMNYEVADMIYDCIDNAPTVDAVEVVHSEWILNGDGSGTCKHCHRTTKNCWDYDTWMNYCPGCGAKMDGERKDNESCVD
jgi:hypothetical protein